MSWAEAFAGMNRCDQAWSPVWVTSVVGPLDGVDAASIRARHAGLLALLPASSWLRRDGRLTIETVDGDPTDTAVRRGAEVWGGSPLHVVLGDGPGRGHVAVMHSHGVGDGTVSRHLVRDLLAPTGAPYTLPALGRVSMRRLGYAAAVLWSSRPLRLVRATRAVLAPGAPAWRSSTPVETVPVLLRRRIGADRIAALRHRRDEQGTVGSVSMLLLGALLEELSRRGVALDQVTVPVNLRRYSCFRRSPAGNMVAMIRLPADLSARGMRDRVVAALENGEPLLAFLITWARLALRPSRDRPGPRAERVAVLGWSDRGRLDGWEALPWSGPARVSTGLVPVWGRRVNVNLGRVGDDLHLSLSINAAAFDVGAVTEALDAALNRIAPAEEVA